MNGFDWSGWNNGGRKKILDGRWSGCGLVGIRSHCSRIIHILLIKVVWKTPCRSAELCIIGVLLAAQNGGKKAQTGVDRSAVMTHVDAMNRTGCSNISTKIRDRLQ